MVKELLRARIITGRVMSSIVCEKHFHNTAVMPRRVRNCARGRGIQYAAASRFNYCCLGVLDRPAKPGDDSECVAI